MLRQKNAQKHIFNLDKMRLVNMNRFPVGVQQIHLFFFIFIILLLSSYFFVLALKVNVLVVAKKKLFLNKILKTIFFNLVNYLNIFCKKKFKK